METNDYKDAKVIQSVEYDYDDDGNVISEVHATFIPNGGSASLKQDEDGDMIVEMSSDDDDNDDDDDWGDLDDVYMDEEEWTSRLDHLAATIAEAHEHYELKKAEEKRARRRAFWLDALSHAIGMFVGYGLVELLFRLIT